MINFTTKNAKEEAEGDHGASVVRSLGRRRGVGEVSDGSQVSGAKKPGHQGDLKGKHEQWLHSSPVVWWFVGAIFSTQHIGTYESYENEK